MVDYTLIHFDEVPPQHFGQKPKDVDVRFYRNQLGMTGGGMTIMQFGPGLFSTPHRHKQQEEVYLVIDGDVEIKLEDEIIKLNKFDAIRISKEMNRSLRNRGKKSAIVLGFGTPNTGPGDAINVDHFWS